MRVLVTLDEPRVNLVRQADGIWNRPSADSYPPMPRPPHLHSQQSSRQASVDYNPPPAWRRERGGRAVAQGNASVALSETSTWSWRTRAPACRLKETLKAAWASAQQNVEADFKVEPRPTSQRWPEVTLYCVASDLSVHALRDFLPASQAAYLPTGSSL